MDRTPPRALIAIDLLRFACAMLVVAFHFGAAFARAPGLASAALLRGLAVPDTLTGATWFGWVGVELFFVISGLVIARSAEGVSARAFLRRRVLRLVPAAWVCATATYAVLALAAPRPGLGAAWWVSVGFWPNGIAIDPSYWTLGIELFFYLLVATGLGNAGTFAAIERRALAAGGLSTAFWAAALATGWAATPLIDYRPAQLLLLPHGCLFALGVTIHGMLTRGATRGRIAALTTFGVAGLVEIAARTVERGHMLGLAVAPTLPMLAFLAGVAVLLGSIRMQPWLVRHVPARFAATLGLMTYPLYLIHQEVGAAIVAALLRGGCPFLAALACAFAVVAGFAWWVARSAEPAVRGLLVAAFSVRHALARDRRRSASPRAG